VGIALEEGFITSIEDPITQYVPSLGESAYNGVRIKDVLQMSSGVRWTEDYSDPTAEIHDFGEVKVTGRSINDYMQEKLCEPLGMEAPGFWLLGYTYQWWLPEGDRGEFSAIGIYNQCVYVDPSRDVVIVKLPANRACGTSSEEATNREDETIDFLLAVAAQCEGNTHDQ
jgi:CubicO group peptidase (beta-lactamase class C family)